LWIIRKQKVSSNFGRGDKDLFRIAENILNSRILLEEKIKRPGEVRIV
jgi:hypothetical protein